MLSKIAYEAQAENGTKTDKEQDQSKKGNNKKSKKSTMSLDEFNNMGAISTQNSIEKPEDSEVKTEGSFFSHDCIITFNYNSCGVFMKREVSFCIINEMNIEITGIFFTGNFSKL